MHLSHVRSLKYISIISLYALLKMADNYLEKKFQDMAEHKNKKRKVITNKSIDSLLLRNRSHRGYDATYKVSSKELEEIISVNALTPSARNQQMLRFLPITGEEAAEMRNHMKLGGALPELGLPLPGSEPNAYILICSKGETSKWTMMDVGISAQSMLLKAVDMGLNGICIGAFEKEFAKSLIHGRTGSKGMQAEQLEPELLMAFGKGTDHIQILPIDENENHNYFRENGVHFVPKVKKSQLIIK